MENKLNNVESVIRAYFSGLNSKDIEQVTGLFTNDAVLMLNDAKTVKGMGAISEMYKHRFSNVNFGRELHIDEQSVDGDLAFVRAHSAGTVTPLSTGKAMEVLGRELFVLQMVEGIWKIRCYMMNQPKE